MSEAHRFLAMDYGAESGRGILVTLADGKATMEEIHRFPNRRVNIAGTMYWDTPFLFAEMLEAMKLCAAKGVRLTSMAVDTWGVDFGLLDERGKLLGLPVSYRDGRTETVHEYADPIVPREDVFLATGGETWAIGSLYQLLSMQRDGDPTLTAAKCFLNMPNLLTYLLTGKKCNERSILSGSSIMGVDRQWPRELFEKFNLPPNIFGEIVEPGTVVGPLQPDVAEQTGLGELPVVAGCGHDTAAVVASIPAEGDNWAFISCGTWSILGTLVGEPVATPACLQAGFCNEYTLGGWYMCNHILGLWLVQECKRKWDTQDDPWDYGRITDEAAKATYDGVLDVTDATLMAPADMEEALLAVLAKHRQPKPESRGQLIRCVLESLALEYARQIDTLNELSGERKQAFYMVGGGIRNKLLCQLTADACGIPLHAGAEECTALGNALTQALAMGVLQSPADIRQVMRNSTEMTTYQPTDQEAWVKKREVYKNLRK
ncbi:MAG: rhamnulokinase [Phycisphaerae bacterium]|nr:rhamnulokinase [Phycisphaerae bacterium]